MGGGSQSVVVDVSPEDFYGVITDFKHYPDFVNTVVKADVVKHTGNTYEVDFEVNLFKTIRYTLKMVGDPGKKLSWSLIRGDLFKVMNGSWELEPAAGGKSTKATYTADVDFAIFVPKMITNKLTAVSLPSTLKEFKERAESL